MNASQDLVNYAQSIAKKIGEKFATSPIGGGKFVRVAVESIEIKDGDNRFNPFVTIMYHAKGFRSAPQRVDQKDMEKAQRPQVAQTDAQIEMMKQADKVNSAIAQMKKDGDWAL